MIMEDGYADMFCYRRGNRWCNDPNILIKVMHGFPPKTVRWESGRVVCDPYWKILTVRRSLRYNFTGLSADINSFAWRIASHGG